MFNLTRRSIGALIHLSRASILVQMKNGRTLNEKYLHDYTYHGQELSVTEAKDVLNQYLDNHGSMNLEKGVNGIAKICLSNPRLRNAINVKMISELNDIIDELYQWTECKGLILYGADGNFCSGGDLKTAKIMNNSFQGYAMSVYIGHILDKLSKLPIITVAYIEGTGAIGGGAEVSMACDYRIMCNADDTTVIGFVHSKMGIVPAWGSTGRLVSILGVRKTMDLLLEAKMLSSTKAIDLGLVDGTVATLADAEAWLSNKIKSNVNVIRAIKRTVKCYENSGEAVQMLESRIFAPLWGGPANRAAIERNLKHKK
ncbi:ethylmalonyl-CoA decarboxylase-like [Melanaphis sacchari]|uniref:Ethylmalonyl-CoA decarboxylase n=1 Tax=Melanaphis sacchari TaxID=742174 RepID=A0A2H8TL76_9HEMI|nr:ethylmalonyl-CoA decarboxylase-like [Melanaphis sacchari]